MMDLPGRSLRNFEALRVFEEREATIEAADAAFVAAHPGETCKLCNAGPHIPFSMAFQPIVDVSRGTVLAYEALARGPQGELAETVLGQTLHNHRYSIDQRCREKAIAMSSALGILDSQADLSVNFYPNAVYEPKQCLRRTFQAASSVGFPLKRIIFEVTEVEEVRDHDHLKKIMMEYKSHGPDLIKIDRKLVERIDERGASRTIVKSIVQVCRELGIMVIAEGVERRQEMQVLCDLEIFQMQGYFFAPPAFEALPKWIPGSAGGSAGRKTA